MFAKIFSQIYDSSIAENYTIRHVFMDLLVLADSDGVVDMTAEAISRRTNVPLDLIKGALAQLELPDDRSRSHDHDGCRIVRIDSSRDWGWQVINYQHYRNLIDEDARRTYFRDYRRKEREAKRVAKAVQSVHNCSTELNRVTHAEAEAEAEAEVHTSEEKVGTGGKEKQPAARAKAPTLPDDLFFSELKRHYPDIDIERELGKMRAFFLTPKAKSRKMTRRFVVGWLNRCDVPIKSPGSIEKRSMANGYYPRISEPEEQPISLEEQAEYAAQFSKLKAQMNGAERAGYADQTEK